MTIKVALFVHCFFPDHIYGTETYTLNLAKNLRAFGYEPIIVSAIFPGEKKNETPVSYYEYDGLPVYVIDKNYYPHARLRDTYYQEELQPVFENILQKIKPDIVHVTHFTNHTGVLLEVLNRNKIPVVATLTDFYGFCMKCTLRKFDGSLCYGPNTARTNCMLCYAYHLHETYAKAPNGTKIDRLLAKYPILLNLKFLLSNVGLKTQEEVEDIFNRPEVLLSAYGHLSAVIVPTKFTRKMYEKNGLKVPIYQIPFGVDECQQNTKTKRPADWRLRFGFIGQMDYHKGVDILMDAFCRLPSGQAILDIYGSEMQNPDYCKMLRAKSVGHNINFCGTFPSEKLNSILEGLDFVVIPSRWYENSPLTLLASLASHTPVIVSDVDGLTEFIKEGKSGFAFELGNRRQLEKILSRIVKMPQQALLMQQTTDYAWNWNMMTKETTKVYESVLQ